MNRWNNGLARTAALALSAGAALPLLAFIPAANRQPLAVGGEARLCASAPSREHESDPVNPVILSKHDAFGNFEGIGNAWELASGVDCRTARGWGEGSLGVIGMAALSAAAAFNLVPGKAAASTAIKTGIKELAEAGRQGTGKERRRDRAGRREESSDVRCRDLWRNERCSGS
jgi:hypothetical protein